MRLILNTVAPRLPRLLPAGAKVAGRDSHPLKDSAFARRTPTGCSRVDTARDMLLYCLQASGAHVRRSAIVASTEWDFHPQGAFRIEALGKRATDDETLKTYLDALALTLDPCVADEVRLHDA